MRRRTAAFLVLTTLGLLATAWFAFRGRALGPDPAAARRAPPQAQPTAAVTAPQRAQLPERDIFRFADERTAAASAPVVREARASAAQPQATSSPVTGPRLLGFVRTPAGVKAALALGANVEVLAPDEQGQGYSVLAIDEDSGSVRLRTPTAEEIEVVVAPR
jgi:hypothetical protein